MASPVNRYTFDHSLRQDIVLPHMLVLLRREKVLARNETDEGAHVVCWIRADITLTVSACGVAILQSISGCAAGSGRNRKWVLQRWGKRVRTHPPKPALITRGLVKLFPVRPTDHFAVSRHSLLHGRDASRYADLSRELFLGAVPDGERINPADSPVSTCSLGIYHKPL